MTTATNAPNDALLRAILDGTLPETEQARVLALLESDAAWRQALDRLAAGAQTWEAVADFLPQPPLVADDVLRSAIASGMPPTMADHPPTSADDGKLGFLDPSEDANYLGGFGPYLVERVVGRGGFGIVLKALDPQLRRIVALKVLAPHFASHTAACQRFLREGRAAASVVHDHVITIHGVGDQPLPHLVMQYVAGQSLQEKIDACGPLGVKEVLRIGVQTAAGLAAAHKQGQVHRDIKPANILLENGVERVKITDFGLARAADDASMTQSGTVAGTPQYMSPEQARGETVDCRSDLFSLGSVLYAMCAGRPPFRATTTMGVLKRVCDDPPRPLREVNPEVPDWLADIIGRLMAKNPADRFASAAEVSDLLSECLSHVQQPGATPLPLAKSLTPHRLALPQAAAALANVARPTASDDALLESARRSVREPAIGLIITGILNWVALAVIFIFLSNLLQDMMRNDTYRWLIPVLLVLGLGSGCIVLGGLKMLRLENRSLVTLAAIAAMIIGPGYFVGFAMGLWALVVLQRREVKEAFTKVRRRHWPGLADAPAELPEEGEWSCRCTTCGYIAPADKWGIVRIGAASRGKWTILLCPKCRWLSWISVERFSAKSLPAQKSSIIRKTPLPAPASSSNGLGLALFVVFLVFAIPLTLLFAAGLGYFLMSSGSPTPNIGRMAYPPEATGGLIFQNEDARFEVSMYRVKSPSGEHVVGDRFGPELRHNQYLRVAPGEYRAEVRCDGMVVREDTFHVAIGGTPTTYSVGAGGTLQFLAAPGDESLALVLNHVTGQTIWDWPQRQSCVVPEGLVHVDLRRPIGDGSYHVLTNNYFDIVAGQKTVIRVREKDVEIVAADGDLSPVLKLRREALDAVERQYEAGQVTKRELLDARRSFLEAEYQEAIGTGRVAAALEARQRIVALAEEKARIVQLQVEAGTLPTGAVTEARLEVLNAQRAVERTKANLPDLKEKLKTLKSNPFGSDE